MAACTWAEGAFIANSCPRARLRMFATVKLNQSFWEDFNDQNVRRDRPWRRHRLFAAGRPGAVRNWNRARRWGRLSQKSYASQRQHEQRESQSLGRTHAHDAPRSRRPQELIDP